MRILYVGNFTERDSPLGYCPNAEWIRLSFEALGHRVDTLNERDATPEDVLAMVDSNTYRFILCEEGRLKGDHAYNKETKLTEIQGKFEEVMKGAGIPVVPWLTNIFHGIMRREIELRTNPIFRSQIVFSTDGGHDKEFADLGINHRLLRQGIYEPEAKLGTPTYPTTAEIAFVGSIYEDIWPYRKQLINFLKLEYKERFLHVGERGEVRHQHLNNLCATVKIIVGDSVYSPKYWSNRVYEIIGRGGFLIHPMVEGLDKEFTPYKHFVPYTLGDFAGLKEKIDYFLKANDQREQIRRDGLAHCREFHTYTHRVKDLISTLEKEHII